MITTARVELIPATEASVLAALDGPAALGRALDAVVPAGWPPQFLDTGALEWTLERVRNAPGPWWMHFAVMVPPAAPARTLVGTAGYKGPPDALGVVEVGYGVVAEFQRRGLATEFVHGLVGAAFARPEVTLVIAETLPELIPSQGVLKKCGFTLMGGGSDPGVIRFALPRPWRTSKGIP